MLIQLNVTVGDEVKTVTAGIPDIMALEDKFDIDASELGKRQRLKWLVFLAWNALKRQGETEATFEDFAESVVNLDVSDQGNA